MKAHYKHCSTFIVWFVLLFGVAYPMSLGPVLWYHRRTSGEGFSKPTLRVLNVVYRPLELVFDRVPLTKKMFEVYCIWLWTQLSDRNPGL